MCRFLAYLGHDVLLDALLTRPPNSLVHQSYDAELRSPLNGDGFGVAWYVPEVCDEPGLFRDVMPAWSNQNLHSIARVTRTPCILGHVRAASPGLPVMLVNCHPFRHGRFAFMHNGFLAGFSRVRRPLLDALDDHAFDAIQGTTDSEHLFGLFLHHHGRLTDGTPLERMADALERTLHHALELLDTAGIDEMSALNIAVSDGRHLVASRFTGAEPSPEHTLFTLAGPGLSVTDDAPTRMISSGRGAEERHDGDDHVEHEDRDELIELDDVVTTGAVLIASEPLDHDPRWTPVPLDHLVLVDETRGIELRPCGVPSVSAAAGNDASSPAGEGAS